MKFVNMKTLISVLFVCLIFIVSQTSQVSAFSVKELLGLGTSEPELADDKKTEPKPTKTPDEKSQNTEWAKTADKEIAANPQIDLDYVALLVTNMNVQERAKILADQKLFKQVVENEANNRSAASAAIANNLVHDRNIGFLMRRGAENILRESYLNRLIASKLPKDFPSDEQLAEYFESNKEQFIVPERIHVWQIFFTKSKDSDEKAIAALKKKAEKIISDIKKGNSDYSNVALSLSEHEQSRSLGGYMGLIKTNELLPEIKEPVLKLKEGEISKPVESESGIHIIKRGKILKAEPLKLAQVEQQIRQLLTKQAHAQLRNAIFTQARKEYPQDISDNKLEEWRLRLKTNTNQ